jgi:hypothetical protein
MSCPCHATFIALKILGADKARAEEHRRLIEASA